MLSVATRWGEAVGVLRTVAGLALLSLLAACEAETAVTPDDVNKLVIGLEVSARDPGDPAVVTVLATGPDALGALQGRIHFDRSKARYIGQYVDANTVVMVNDAKADRGTVRFMSLDVNGIPRNAAQFAFEVLEPNFATSLTYEQELAVQLDETVLRVPYEQLPTNAMRRPTVELTDPRRMTLADWIEYRHPGNPAVTTWALPGEYIEGLRFGDPNLDGLQNGVDALIAASVGVGNFPLLTDPNRDNVIAADVRPENAPGIGEPGDPIPPGREPDGRFVIDGADALAIALFATQQAAFPVGEVIPGREPRPTDRVVLSGDILVDRLLTRDTIYELQGTVRVPDTVTLQIEAGTRIEGDAATRGALVVNQAGTLLAVGSRLQPIVFTCTTANPEPGCWGGVSIRGSSILNNGIRKLPDGSILLCPIQEAPGDAGFYGGCIPDDDSGELHYVRVEYAGQRVNGSGPLPGLGLYGVGSGTAVDFVQVHQSLGAGFYVSGGVVGLRHIMVTDPGVDGFFWDDGWLGRMQFLAVQAGETSFAGSAMLRGSSSGVDEDSNPHANPTVFNVTLVAAEPSPAGTLGGMSFESGSAGHIYNAVVQGASGAGLEIDGTAACAQGVMGRLHVATSIFFANGPDFSDDADCIDEVAYAQDPGRNNRVVDPELMVSANTLTPDLRPVPSSPATTGFTLPPSGFFDVTATFVGAVDPQLVGSANVPWYAGWTIGW